MIEKANLSLEKSNSIIQRMRIKKLCKIFQSFILIALASVKE